MSSIQRIVENSGISRGSFYQYFRDKSGVYFMVIKKITDEKIQIVSRLMPMQEEMGIYDFFYELFRTLFDWGIKKPEYRKIGIDFYTSKTLDRESILKSLTKEAYDMINSTPETFLIRPIQNSIEKGEISPRYDVEDVNIYILSMFQGMKNVMINKNVSDIFGEKGNKVLKQFISMLRYGLSNKQNQ
jgi:AcrR family transcriptional regulator